MGTTESKEKSAINNAPISDSSSSSQVKPNGVVRRGYSHFSSPSEACVKGASTHTNVLIKKTLPARGVASSNPKRVERLLHCAVEDGLFTNVKEHTNVGWGVTIHTVTYKNVDMFVAGVPMGAAGSGFAFFEMFAAGAQVVS